MLKLAQLHAVLAGTVPTCLAQSPRVETAARAEPTKALSSASTYALAAMRKIELDGDPELYSFAGPTGSTMHLFDRAWKASTDGRLVGSDFVRRSRRIHPFTLLLSLHNQVAATLSLELGLRGAATNVVDSPASFVDLMPNMAAAQTHRPVLALLSSATDRAEERTRLQALTDCETGVEGAIALLFTSTGGLGELAPAGESGSVVSVGAGLAAPDGRDWPFGPCLEAGLGLLWALETDRSSVCFEIGSPGRTARFEWTRT